MQVIKLALVCRQSQIILAFLCCTLAQQHLIRHAEYVLELFNNLPKRVLHKI